MGGVKRSYGARGQFAILEVKIESPAQSFIHGDFGRPSQFFLGVGDRRLAGQDVLVTLSIVGIGSDFDDFRLGGDLRVAGIILHRGHEFLGQLFDGKVAVRISDVKNFSFGFAVSETLSAASLWSRRLDMRRPS